MQHLLYRDVPFWDTIPVNSEKLQYGFPKNSFTAL
jgi:hypothetical protein